MSSAASRASKNFGSSQRNRPSLAMSAQQPDNVDGPLVAPQVQSQHASLSERLAQENASSSSNTATNKTGSASGEGEMTMMQKKPKVRFAETLAVASTLDAERAQAESNADGSSSTSLLESISNLFGRKYTIPIFLIVSTSIFLLVHLTSTGTTGGKNEIYAGPKSTLSHVVSQNHAQSSLDTEGTTPTSYNTNHQDLKSTRSYNVADGTDGFTSVIFSFVPTPSSSSDTENDETPIPTVEVVSHITPKVHVRAGIPDNSGYEPGWVLVPTTSDGKGGEYVGGDLDVKEGWGYPPGVPTPDPALLPSEGNYNAGGWNGIELAPDKWGIPQGQPTPDPALLSNVSPLTQKWNFPPGYPTPDPIYLPAPTSELGKTQGSQVGMGWGYPPGVPTPNPDLLVEVAPDNPSPTTLGWNTPLGSKPKPDNTGPVAMKWNIPLGKPTPDPALLNGVDGGSPTTLGWNYPPGVPTPDPALLGGVPDEITWGYPPGVPTPDPALLEGTVDSMTWGYPPGVPTPDPALLSGESPMPTLRNVETGINSPPTKRPFEVTVKNPGDLSPIPNPPKDSAGNVIEVAPPPPVPLIPISVKNPGLMPRPPTPQVNTQPYRPDRPGRAPTFLGLGTGTRPPRGPRPVRPGPAVYPQQGGYIMGGCGGCCGGCCGCGGGMMMMNGFMGAVPASDGSSLMVPQFAPGTTTVDTRFHLPGGLSLPGLQEPECPWECMIDETVPTKGRSNEDDAIYEIFYTNPLNCCGTIVEIGAGNGEDNSPSYFFEYGMNWTAILTEADPTNFDEMTKARTGDKAALRNGAFCQEGSHIYFDEQSRLFQTQTPGQYSSEAVSAQEFAVTDETTKVDCIRLDSDILAGLDHVNVMIIRVKGDPWSVVRTMDWDVTVDIWVILMEDKPGMLHDTLRAALKLHDYVPAAWEIKLWCETPSNCMQNEVWLRKSFSALPKPLMGVGESHGLRGSLS